MQFPWHRRHGGPGRDQREKNHVSYRKCIARPDRVRRLARLRFSDDQRRRSDDSDRLNFTSQKIRRTTDVTMFRTLFIGALAFAATASLLIGQSAFFNAAALG